MSEKKQIYKAEVMALPPLKMVLGDIPSPNPRKDEVNSGKRLQEHTPEMESVVNKLIAHLKGRRS